MSRYGPASVFKDVETIPLGLDFRDVIRKALGKCKVVLAVIGRDWVSATDEAGERRLDNPADFVRIELEATLERGIPVVPVLVDDAPIPKARDLPESLGALVYRNGIPIRPDPDFDHDMDRLEDGLDRILTA